MNWGYQPAVSVTQSRVLAMQMTPFTAVSNVAVETQVAGLTLPATSVVAGRQLVFETAGTVLNNTGGNLSTLVKVKLAGTAVLTSTAFTMGTAADPRKWHLRATINIITTASQRTAADWLYTLSGTENWGAYSAGAVGTSSSTVDLTAGGVVEFVATPAIASVSYTMQAQWASLTEVF
ncbi:hypothetical protein ACQP2Y_21600 [Actinoplanes sp. CA-051413]|uniref:hypothetical protein n=1 Tax=Actinoplanes sp. CA-051413 TaxID=3239899 RepID=UPI003D9662C7